MRGARFWTALLLTGAFLLAAATPFYLAYARPGLGAYLLHPSVFLIQALPYTVAAALWVPAWSWGSDMASVVLAALLMAIALVVYVPMLWTPGQWGGDMIALTFLAISGATISAVLVVSILAAVAHRLRRKRAPGPSSRGVAP